MKRLKKIFNYAFESPLGFFGLSCWFGLPILGFFDGALDLNIPGWFLTLMFFLGALLLGLSQKYEKNS